MEDKKITVKVSIEFEYDINDYLDDDGDIDMENLYSKVEYDMSDTELEYFTIKAKGLDGEEFDLEPW